MKQKTDPLAGQHCTTSFWTAVGMAHVLRSGLVMGYATSYLPLIVVGTLRNRPDPPWH